MQQIGWILRQTSGFNSCISIRYASYFNWDFQLFFFSSILYSVSVHLGMNGFSIFFKYNLFVSERYEIDKKEQDISFPITSCKKLVKFRLFQALNIQFSEFLEFYIIFRPPVWLVIGFLHENNTIYKWKKKLTQTANWAKNCTVIDCAAIPTSIFELVLAFLTITKNMETETTTKWMSNINLWF